MSTATNHPTFGQWLAQQIERDDPVGDIARDVGRTQRARAWDCTLQGLLSYITKLGGSNKASKAARQAWREYVKQHHEHDEATPLA